VTTRPNIIMMLADDHAAHAMSCYGSELNDTPQLDRLAAGGMRFDDCFCTNSICTPSRATILTGTYSHVNGVTTLATLFDARQETFPALLRAAGYQTAVIGKWHLGHGGIHDPRGFDHWEVLPDQGDYRDPELLSAAGSRVVRGYTTTVLTDLALEWLEATDPRRPFLLLLHHKAPHRPWVPDTAHAALFDGVDLPVPPTFDDDHRHHARAARTARMRIDRDLGLEDLKATPPSGLSPADEKRWRYQRYMEDYLRCVASIDDNTGRVLDWLDATGRADDTMVIYSSDQGFFLGDHGWYDKRFMYEESLRMPLLWRWPGVVEPGSTNDDLVLNTDVAPTLLAAAGLAPTPRMQGRSLLPLLRGERPTDWRTSLYYRYWMHLDSIHRVEAHAGVRTRDRKLVYYYGDGAGQPGSSDEVLPPAWELFDLDADPYELRSVHDDPAYAGDLRRMRDELRRLAAALGDDLHVPRDP
jgi:arylsulfatase A-like enzyme